MADSPEQLAQVLADLEARKESLKHRLSSLDSTIQGIQAIITPVAEAPPPRPQRIVVADEELTAVPVRESVVSVPPDVEVLAVSDTGREREESQGGSDSVLVDSSQIPATRPAQLKRPIPQVQPERRKPGSLNIYVNRNAEWAARQLVAAQPTNTQAKPKTSRRCPSCGSHDTRASVKKGVADMFMFLFDYSVARCRNCDTRFRIWPTREADEAREAESQSD